MKTTTHPIYCTDHLYLAAYLICSGHSVVGTNGSGNRISFVFSQSPQLSIDAANYMAGGLVVARRFSFEILKLKRLIPRTNGSQDILKKVGENEITADCSNIGSSAKI